MCFVEVDYPNNTNESLAVLPLVHDRLPHPVDVLGALPLALLQTDVADNLGPAGIQAQLLEVLPQLLLLLAVCLLYTSPSPRDRG